MDPRFKTPIIAGSIIAVLIGLIVMGALAYRARLSEMSPVETQDTANGSSSQGGGQALPSGAKPPVSSGTTPGGVTQAPAQNGVKSGGVATPDFTDGPDRDKDGLSDAAEAVYGTDPGKSDTDGDGWSDKDEATVYGSNPLDKASTPATMPGHEKFEL